MDHLSFNVRPKPPQKPPGPDMTWFYLVLFALGAWAVILMVIVLVFHP